MNIERLEHLITVLERVRDAHLPFNLAHWIAPLGENVEMLVGDVTLTEACGTACCAAGYAALDPEFQAQGFYFYVSEGKHIKDVRDFNAMVNQHGYHGAMPFYDGQVMFDACSRFFELSGVDTMFLFDPETYQDDPENDDIEDWRAVTPEEVIQRIRKLLGTTP